MSLIDVEMEDFIIMDKSTINDGYGGTKDSYAEGVTIQGAMPYDGSMQAKIAQANGVTSVYTLTVKRNVYLDYHTVLKRKKNGLYFRTTDNADDKETPSTSSLDIRQYSTEAYKLPE